MVDVALKGLNEPRQLLVVLTTVDEICNILTRKTSPLAVVASQEGNHTLTAAVNDEL